MSLDKLPEHIILFISSFLKTNCKIDINYKGLMLSNKLYYNLLNSIPYECKFYKLQSDLKDVLNYDKNHYCTCHNGLSKSTLNKLNSLLNNKLSIFSTIINYNFSNDNEFPEKHFIHFDTLDKAEKFINLKRIFRFKIRLNSRCCNDKGIGFYFI